MLKNLLFNIGILLLITNFSMCIKRIKNLNMENQLIQNRRSFIKFIDEEKLISYLSSFGGDQSFEESRKHMIYKRASGRIKKIKKLTSSDSLIALDTKKHQKSDESVEIISNSKNFKIIPRHMVKFELEDAKYNEEYENLRNYRKLRVKRSENEQSNNKNIAKVEKFITKETFVEPKEILKFLYTDAVTMLHSKSSSEDKKLKNEKKSKREIGIDATTSNSIKIKITHPLSSSVRTKHVTFNELPSKVQKIVENAITDAISKGKASDGDYLKFYYGDKIIRVPIYLSKYITKIKDASKGLSDNYTLEKIKFQKDDVVSEPLQQSLNLKDSYSRYQTVIKPLLPEKAESFVNFATPKENLIKKLQDESIKIPQSPPKKSIFFYSSSEDSLKNPKAFNKISSKVLEKKYYENQNQHASAFKEITRDSIPITEDFNESKLNEPIPLSAYPTSYIEYDDNLSDKHINFYEDKNYAFGYHVSDYKSGNNFGHSQTKHNKEIKGEYSILLPDGRIQITKYFADDSGFHADVSYQNVH